jgi:hypothetical protein
MTIVPKDLRVYASCVYPVACLIMVMYNNGIRHDCNELLTAFESDLAADGLIDLHREGDMSSYLSVRYLNNTQTGEITADQESYTDTLLDQYNMANCNPNTLPLKTFANLAEIASRLPETPDRELVSLYCKLIGELMFVAINTQPLIAHSVNALARFMSNANHELYTLAKDVLRYLVGHKARKLTWCAQGVKFPFHPCELYAYADSSWADVVPSRKSSQCYLVFCNNAVFSWKATLALSLQCLPPRQNSLPFVLALLMSRIAAKLPMNLAFYNYALPLSTKIILVRKQSQKMATLRGDLNTLSFDGAFFITISTAVLSQSKQSSAIYSLLI